MARRRWRPEALLLAGRSHRGLGFHPVGAAELFTVVASGLRLCQGQLISGEKDLSDPSAPRGPLCTLLFVTQFRLHFGKIPKAVT